MKSLERNLETEIMNCYGLSREVENLRLAKKKLEREIVHLVLDKDH